MLKEMKHESMMLLLGLFRKCNVLLQRNESMML